MPILVLHGFVLSHLGMLVSNTKSLNCWVGLQQRMARSGDVTLGLECPTRVRPTWPGSPISTRWTASYSISGSDSHLDGGLILRHAERRLVLPDQEGIAVDVCQADPVEPIEPGSVLVFSFFRAMVGEIWASPIAPSRLGRSPLRPRRALGPRAKFYYKKRMLRRQVLGSLCTTDSHFRRHILESSRHRRYILHENFSINFFID
jgi:hypothetical protein